MTRIVCIANQKGGVGKTTTAVNLAAGLARRGKQVLLVDLDIQGSATATLVAPAPDREALSMAACLVRDVPLDDIVVATSTSGLFVAPAGEELATVDLHLASVMGRERALERVLRGASLERWDVVLVDTAPYLGLLTINALVSAEKVLVPVSCEYLPMLGLKLFEATLGKIRRTLGAPCDVLGYLLTMVDRRERVTEEVEAMVRGAFGERVFPGIIRVNTRHKASPSHRQTIFEYEGARGKGREDYEALTREVERRLGLAPTRAPRRPTAEPRPEAPAAQA